MHDSINYLAKLLKMAMAEIRMNAVDMIDYIQKILSEFKKNN